MVEGRTLTVFPSFTPGSPPGSSTDSNTPSEAPTSSTSSSSAVTHTSSESSTGDITQSQSPSSTSSLVVSGSPEATQDSAGNPSSPQSLSIQSSTSQSFSAQSSTSQSFLSAQSLTISSSSSLPVTPSSGGTKSTSSTQSVGSTQSSFPPQSSSGRASPSPHNHRHISPSAAVTAGCIIGAIAALILFALGIYFFLRRRRARLAALHHSDRSHPEPYNLDHKHPQGSTEKWLSEKTSPLGTDALPETPPLHPPTRPESTIAASDIDNDDTRSLEPIESELVAMRQTVAQMMADVQRLQARIEGGETSTIRSEAPPPTYESGS
ncbi:hypothetical protein GYMLUDRAFT_249660 [Collybiopsis luxurians FD-317 M1]|uniref:Uncharacterized protein n=1 Tax=Collybiopsis luxurians FD-317 M1 TaxID=944289 RepID=A0A0D0CGW6_9AGAR|nr:hypothetical protein GYMLUDRAFT_249660 [Collybiopsis luxurians FD-317 M1]